MNQSVPVAATGEFAPVHLGPLAVWPPVILAPMAGVTNYPFRRLCREFGAGLYVAEMITARGFLEGNVLTHKLASGGPDEQPRSVQLYGTRPEEVEAAAALLVADGVKHLDLNFGCPVPKVTRNGGGAAIPVKPRLMARIVRAAVRGAGTTPVTVKVRKGINDDLLTYLDAGRVAADEGAVAIGLHARTAAQLYSGAADWDAIARLKASVRIPVLGNGDIWECWDALRMMRATGCDGVIIGRGCLGRPWLFRELADVFAGTEPAPPPRLGEITAIVQRHAQMLSEFFSPQQGIRQMRKWCGWYTAGFHGANAVRRGLSQLDSLAELATLLAPLDPSEPFPRSVLRIPRGKDGRQQNVALPQGYLREREDDTPPAEEYDGGDGG